MTRFACAILVCLAGALAAAAAPASEITDIRYGEHDGFTRIVIESDNRLDYSVFTLAEHGMRVVVDLPRVLWRGDADQIAENQLRVAGYGPVAQARFGHYTADTSRMVFDLTGPYAVARHFHLEPRGSETAHRLVLDLEETGAAAFAAMAGFPDDAGAAADGPEPAVFRAPSTRTVVVDAGHGGRDPGAIGASGKFEKDITFAAALSLKRALEAKGGYEVILTRAGDVKLELEDRVQVAREQNADLFISLHADSIADPNVRGASVYTLSKRGSQRAKQKVLDSNWIMDVALTSREPVVNGILVDLAQRETKNQSATFAEVLTSRLPEAGPILRNTHREANFYVLLAPDVPAVLLEMGFMSNRHDEANLSSPDYIERLTGTVADSIEAYFDQRERLFAAR